jgi:Na+(H+)/acetate symporter ActP
VARRRALGLLLQSLLIAGKVRESGAYTLPEIIEKNISRNASRLVSLIIVMPGRGFIAALFVAAAKDTEQHVCF